MLSNIKLPLNWKIIVFLVILEILTVPIVAISNTIVIKNPIYILAMGFGAGAFALLVIMQLIVRPIRIYFSKLVGTEIVKIHGALYIGLISGFLLMFMFYLQELTYRFTNSDYIVGTVSAFFSVSVSLILYTVIEKLFNYGIKIKTVSNQTYLLAFPLKDILVITLLFSLYETIASPLSILWIPHFEHRFLWGIISGIASGVIGGLPITIISYVTGYKITINLKLQDCHG